MISDVQYSEITIPWKMTRVGGVRRVRRGPVGPLAALLIAFLTGCAGDRPLIDRALKREHPHSAQKINATAEYLVYCPDVLELAFDSLPEHERRKTIGPDGRIDLGAYGRLRVEGLTASQIAREIADMLSLPESGVQVSVAEYRSQQIYLFGQVAGLQRAVPYQGPEPVVDLLQRAGGITSGAAPGSVYVVRSGLLEGRPPEVFHVDLRAALLRKDQRTNVPVQPFDQVFVGETRPFTFEKCIPPILRPVYETICGMRWPGASSPTKADSTKKPDHREFGWLAGKQTEETPASSGRSDGPARQQPDQSGATLSR